MELWCLIADMRETSLRNISGWEVECYDSGLTWAKCCVIICAGYSTFLFGGWAVAALKKKKKKQSYLLYT